MPGILELKDNHWDAGATRWPFHTRFERVQLFGQLEKSQGTPEINSGVVLGHGLGKPRWPWRAGASMPVGDAETVLGTLKPDGGN